MKNRLLVNIGLLCLTIILTIFVLSSGKDNQDDDQDYNPELEQQDNDDEEELLSSPSLVNKSRPSEFRSNRPMVITLGRSGGRRSKTVGRPSGSVRLVTSPSGLL